MQSIQDQEQKESMVQETKQLLKNYVKHMLETESYGELSEYITQLCTNQIEGVDTFESYRVINSLIHLIALPKVQQVMIQSDEYVTNDTLTDIIKVLARVECFFRNMLDPQHQATIMIAHLETYTVDDDLVLSYQNDVKHWARGTRKPMPHR
ncbi:MAG: hypothetical protein H7178_10975 [Chitinophagaceae bacterium]|nr:hypothetical protein [Chitinophagaceae bacterium]